MLRALWNIHNMEGFECKTCSSITKFILESINEAKGKLSLFFVVKICHLAKKKVPINMVSAIF
jgi:hypothetical protein